MVEVDAPTRPTMVVGLDGSDGSRAALNWAVAHTVEFGAIQPVTGWRTPFWAATPPAPGNPAPPPKDFFEKHAREQADRDTARIPAADKLETIVAVGHAGRTLCDVAARHDLLVVGSRGRGAVAESITGSTSSYCAAHSKVPVVIVPESTGSVTPAAHVLVGIDGSSNSIAALTWAIDHSPLGATIEALHAFVPGAPALEFAETYGDIYEERARVKLKTSLERAVEASTRAPTEYTLVSRMLMADPREALRQTDADLIVVGARGHKGVAYLLLGSVASSLTHKTKTTTVVVPG